MKKSLTAGLSALALAASAASVALIGGSTASQAAGTPSSAYALELTAAGNDIIAADTVSVVSTDGSPVTNQGGGVPDNPLGLNLDLLTVEAENGRASSEVAGVRLNLVGALIAQDPTGQGQAFFDQLGTACGDLASELAALDQALNQITAPLGDALQDLFEQVDQGTQDTPLLASVLAGLELPENLDDVQLENIVNGLCDVLEGAGAIDLGVIQAECNGDTGTANIAGAGLSAFRTVVDTIANSALGLEDVAEITTNRQTANADGTFTVEGLHVDLFDGQIELTVASATCGEVTRDTPDSPDQPDAPSPTPVPTNLPVTG
ncbi:hypothetical protein KUV85_07480 [Nocardioides panacisoli]|uniref:hypothetical protein n=1 Tax=Nocardioides panacisoli TaxID=627624 RepID=UPI001C63329C|nr:hypothetical protein [Nocardioides panacisoli]QYJ05509.1 hypothetical protein KUV85_07480 [Nocardioides panacisoli]